MQYVLTRKLEKVHGEVLRETLPVFTVKKSRDSKRERDPRQVATLTLKRAWFHRIRWSRQLDRKGTTGIDVTLRDEDNCRDGADPTCRGAANIQEAPRCAKLLRR